VAEKVASARPIITGNVGAPARTRSSARTALDAGFNPNLAFSLGISREQLAQAVPPIRLLTEGEERR